MRRYYRELPHGGREVVTCAPRDRPAGFFEVPREIENDIILYPNRFAIHDGELYARHLARLSMSDRAFLSDGIDYVEWMVHTEDPAAIDFKAIEVEVNGVPVITELGYPNKIVSETPGVFRVRLTDYRFWAELDERVAEAVTQFPGQP